jgi:hypothetical protein
MSYDQNTKLSPPCTPFAIPTRSLLSPVPLLTSTSTEELDIAPPSPVDQGYQPPPNFAAETFESIGSSHSVYVMDRIHVLPSRQSQYIRKQFYPIAARKLVPPQGSLCPQVIIPERN